MFCCNVFQSAVFSYSRLAGADVLLGVEMASTREVTCYVLLQCVSECSVFLLSPGWG